MRKSAKPTILLLTAILPLFVLVSCRNDKEDRGWQDQSFVIDEDLFASSKDSVDFILRKAMSHNTRYTTFSSDLSITIENAGNRFSLGGQMRLENGKTFWLSVTKYLFELGRVKMTTDTAWLYSRLGNTASVFVEPTDSGMKLMPTFLRLSQNMLLQQVDTTILTGERSLKESTADKWVIEGTQGDSLAWQLSINKTDFKIRDANLFIRQKETMMQIRLNYLSDNKGFNMQLSIDRKLIVSADFRYSKMRWNVPLVFPMNIPESVPVEVNKGFVRNISFSPQTPMPDGQTPSNGQ